MTPRRPTDAKQRASALRSTAEGLRVRLTAPDLPPDVRWLLERDLAATEERRRQTLRPRGAFRG